MADNLYSNQAYQNLSNQVNTAQLWAAQGVTNDFLQSLAAGTTFDTGNAEVGYTWKVVPTSKGNTVELINNWTKTPVTQTQALSYVQTPNPSKQQTYVYDMNEVQRIVDAYTRGGATNYQVVYISPDGDPYKRRVYDITASAPAYTGPTNITGPTAGTAVTPESLINSVTQQPTQFTPITPVTPTVTGTTTQTGAPATVTYPTPINQQTTKDATTGAETATVVGGPQPWEPGYGGKVVNSNTGSPQPWEPGYGGTTITPKSSSGTQSIDPAAPGYVPPNTSNNGLSVGQTQIMNGVTYTITGFNTDGTPIWAGPGQTGGVSGGTINNTGVTGGGTSGGSTNGSVVGGGASTWKTMDTTPIDTINAQDITWRNLPSELFTFPFWREGMSGSTTTAGSTPGYTMQQPRYSPELFFPAAQQYGNWTPSERAAYQSAVMGTGASWDDVFEGLKKKWGVFTNTVQPSWAHTGGTFNWTPAGYSK